jgi:hypothetical protein
VSEQRYLPPRLLQAFGLLLLLAFAVFWALTGRESILLVGSAGSLILLGGYERAREALRAEVQREVKDRSEPK